MSTKNIHNNKKILILSAKGNLGDCRQQLVKSFNSEFEVIT